MTVPETTAPQQYCPTPRELDDLELLSLGAFAPLAGFSTPDSGPTLTVPSEIAASVTVARVLELVDPEGLPLARVALESTYDAQDGTGLVGPVTPLAHVEYGAFRRLHVPPHAVRRDYPSQTITVPVSAPLTTHDTAAIITAADGAPILLLALVGTGTPRGVSPAALIRATLASASEMPESAVVAVAYASRPDADLNSRLRDNVISRYAPGAVFSPSGQGPLAPAVAEIVATDTPPRHERGLVVFFTGLSGSGKSTIARALHDILLEQGTRTVTSLDGDVVRRNISAGLGFSKQDRETNIRRIGWVAAEISRHRGVAICSPIAPFDSTRKYVRATTEAAGGGYVLIHVATPLEECERRDRKDLYTRARRGAIPEFTGISSPYEEPADAELRVDTTGISVDDAVDQVLRVLYNAGWLRHPSSADDQV